MIGGEWNRAGGDRQSSPSTRVSEIKRGKISRFGVGLLFRLAARTGLHPQVELAA
jgi:predicted XRE-type DNA-binding protein